jgi:integrase
LEALLAVHGAGGAGRGHCRREGRLGAEPAPPLEAAKDAAELSGGEDRLSWHSLRHSFASLLATDLELPATTLARLTGHSDAGFTLRVYARDSRDEAALVDDVHSRAAGAGVGS